MNRAAREPYGIAAHRHRFAAWAAGRAASVKGCRFSVEQAKVILEAVRLDALLVGPEALPATDIDAAHAKWRGEVIAEASRLELVFMPPSLRSVGIDKPLAFGTLACSRTGSPRS